jgi:outer membrane lipoprotein SlyB
MISLGYETINMKCGCILLWLGNVISPKRGGSLIMRRSLIFLVIVFAALILSSCAQNQTDNSSSSAAKHATVSMQNGTTESGTVVSSSEKEITIAGDDKITRTIPMDQVRSVEYSDATSTTATDTAPAAPSAESNPSGQNAEAPTTAAATPAAAVQKTQSAATEKLLPTYELPVGTKVAVRTFEAIDSATAAEGQTFSGEVTKDVVDETGNVVIPARSSTEIVIKSASKGGRFRGTSDLVLDLKSVTISGKRYAVETAAISKVGKQGIGTNKRTATYTGGGAALGAIIGAIAGGGKGAAIGAASGAGAGAVTQTITKGSSIKVPAETILTFQLDQPLTVSAEK